MAGQWWREPSYAQYFGPGCNRPVLIDGEHLVATSVRYHPVEVDDEALPYLVRAVVEATPSGPRCVDLRLIAREDGEPVTSTTIRRIPVGKIIWWAESNMDVADSSGDEVKARAAYRRAVTRRERSQSKRPRIDDSTLGKVAEVYRRALATGAAPTAAVQDYFNLGNRARAARWVLRARQEGHLGPAPGRRKQGELRS